MIVPDLNLLLYAIDSGFSQHGVAGNLSTDLQIAALAHCERAAVYSNDTDFLRIPGLSVRNPLVD